jgi:hypothetical protein
LPPNQQAKAQQQQQAQAAQGAANGPADAAAAAGGVAGGSTSGGSASSPAPWSGTVPESAVRNFRLDPGAHMPAPKWGKLLGWGPQDDAMLLLGMCQHYNRTGIS